MIQSVLLMGGLGVLIGTVLVIASKAFYVYEDPKVVAVNSQLPGANCGGCGYPGCGANAEAIVKGLSGVNSCVAAGDEVAQAIAAIMGVSVSDKEPEFAGPGCSYGKNEADMAYTYQGITDCRAASMLFGGMKVCRIGCLGLGTCVRACAFGALSMGPDGLPRVDQGKCTGCGACERACPKHIIRLTSVSRRILREYTLEECVTPCQRACPTGIDIREYIRLIREGDYEGAVQVIKERNPFPTVISRICPAVCETRCRRLLVDESVAINGLKRFVCDYEMTQNQRVMPYKAPASGMAVAIVGGGVEGLSAAFFSARLGHDVTVFEATENLGGILRKAIDRERLPMSVLDWDIEGVKEMGVGVRTKVRIGRDLTLHKLFEEGFKAVFFAVGGWDSRLALSHSSAADPAFPGACLLIDLLRSGTNPDISIPYGHRAVIAGGGSGTVRAVELLKQNKVQEVVVLFRDGADENPLVTAQLQELGASVVHQVGVTMVKGAGDSLTAIEYKDLCTGVTYHLDTDLLVIGSGRFPELVFVPENKGEETEGDPLQTTRNPPLAWKGVELRKKPDTGREIGLMSGQDVVSEYASAVAAINGGRRAAAVIHCLITQTEFQETGLMITETSRLQDVSALNEVTAVPRNLMVFPRKQGEDPHGFSTGFSTSQAQAEADRCLQCGLICYEKIQTAPSAGDAS